MFINNYLYDIGLDSFQSHVVCVLVTLAGKNGENFKGFLLLARDSNGHNVGTFSVSAADIYTVCSVKHVVLYAFYIVFHKEFCFFRSPFSSPL